MALLLPETKKNSLPRTMIQVEVIPTSVSKTFRRRRSAPVKRNIPENATRAEAMNHLNDVASVVSGGGRSYRPYDYQSTLHSVYELQEYGQDDTIHSMTNRLPSRRADSRTPGFYAPYSSGGGGGLSTDPYPQQSIAEDDDEYNDDVDDDIDDDRTRVALQRRLTEQQQKLAAAQTPGIHINDDVIILPAPATSAITVDRQSSSNVPSQLEITAQIQEGDVTGERSGLAISSDEKQDDNNQNEKFSTSPKLQRTMSQDENYFSEHC